MHDQPDPDLTALASSKVIAIGYWRDQAETYWPDVTDFVDNTVDDRSRALVVERLRAGTVVRHYRGASTCRMCGQPNGTAEYTDGAYLWPEGLAHYVDKHHVRLPTRVETHFAANKYVKRTGARTPEIDDSWWLALGNFSWETND